MHNRLSLAMTLSSITELLFTVVHFRDTIALNLLVTLIAFTVLPDESSSLFEHLSGILMLVRADRFTDWCVDEQIIEALPNIAALIITDLLLIGGLVAVG